jgi:hypothetical protein
VDILVVHLKDNPRYVGVITRFEADIYTTRINNYLMAIVTQSTYLQEGGVQVRPFPTRR